MRICSDSGTVYRIIMTCFDQYSRSRRGQRTGKINEVDYRDEREVWLHRGIRLLRVRDDLDARQSLVSTDSTGGDIDGAIEAAIMAYRDSAQPAAHDLSPRESN